MRPIHGLIVIVISALVMLAGIYFSIREFL